jgi:Fe-S cluster assembly protein SufD
VIAATEQQLGNYLESFGEFSASAAGRRLPWLRKLREDGFARFCEVGFPTTHDEDWKFTNTSPIAKTTFALARAGKLSISPKQLDAYRVDGAICQLVFVNGRFAAELSVRGKLPPGVEVASLAKYLDENPDGLQKHLGQYLNTKRDAFCALNTAFLHDGAYVHIAKNVALEQPIALLFVSTGSAPTMTHPRNLIVTEESSEAAVIEEYVSLESGPAFCNAVTELVASEDSAISHYLIEREDRQAYNISTLRIHQGRNANVASHSVLIGGALVRNNVHPVLAGEGGECLINGLFIGNGTQHLDNYMLVEHASPHCGSRQFYNGILDQRAHGVFHGRIIVHNAGQKTDAKQTNRNLLLSDEAQIDTKPQLEIYADDVKCTHGATIGQIDETALFYLRSRGIDEQGARRLLLLAFAGECMERMKAGPARDHVEGLVKEYVFGVAQEAHA